LVCKPPERWLTFIRKKTDTLMAGTEARPAGKELVGRPSLAATFLLVPKLR
jgi:hypothetical protein